MYDSYRYKQRPPSHLLGLLLRRWVPERCQRIGACVKGQCKRGTADRLNYQFDFIFLGATTDRIALALVIGFQQSLSVRGVWTGRAVAMSRVGLILAALAFLPSAFGM